MNKTIHIRIEGKITNYFNLDQISNIDSPAIETVISLKNGHEISIERDISDVISAIEDLRNSKDKTTTTISID